MKATEEQIKTSSRVREIKKDRNLNDIKLSETLGISKGTLYTRLKKHNWKKTEIALISII